jgi:heme/copper-type cytochrome/quinol oxidase subunit 2
MPGDNTPINPVEEVSGVYRLPQYPYAAPYYPQHHEPAISKDSWVRIVMWIIPIIFTAGALFVSVKTMTQRQDDQESALRVEMDRSTKLESEQRIMQSTVQAISQQQDRIVNKVEVIDDKMNEQRSQLSAIGERIGVRVSGGRDR